MPGQNGAKFRHVFVLCTGRTGSMSFTSACGHFDNYSSGHETRCSKLGDERLAYDAYHIEVDNRLSWFLGRLDQTFGNDAFYVHLVRDEEKVAESYNRRWHHRYSITSSYALGILKCISPDRHIAGDMVRTMRENILHFLKDKTNTITIDIDHPDSGFLEFAQRIGASGDMQAAAECFRKKTNVSREEPPKKITLQPLTVTPDALMDLRTNLHDTLQSPASGNSFLKGLFPWRKARAQQKQEQKRRERMEVVEAYEILHSQGIESALSHLSHHSAKTRDLFRAIVADDDDTWTTSMNSWLRKHGNKEILLTPGSEPRFLRIDFERLQEVKSRSARISVIMPAHNAEDTIEAAVNSILRQTWRNLELIVVNDRSSDGTAEILERLASQDSRLVVLHNPVNVGPYVSKNIALTRATGDFVTGHDADDLALPNRLEKQANILLKDPALLGTYGHMLRLDEKGRFNYPAMTSSFSFDGVHRSAMISLMLRREVFAKVGYWDSVRFSADSEFLSRIETVYPGRIYKDRACTMLCLNRSGSLTNNATNGMTYQSGLSPVRSEYKDYWQEWHQESSRHALYHPFSNADRAFKAPDAMIVPQQDIDLVLSKIEENIPHSLKILVS